MRDVPPRRRQMGGRAAMAAIILSALGARASAQTAPAQTTRIAPSPAMERRATERDSLLGLQWMWASRRTLSRYTTPAMCVSGVHRIDFLTWKRSAPDTAAAGTPGDSLATAAVVFGRACGARFTVGNVKSHELPDLVRLALAVGDDSLALAATARRWAEATTEGARTLVLSDGIDAAFANHPARLAFTDSMVRRMDALSPAARTWVIRTRASLLDARNRIAFDTTWALSLTQRNLRDWLTLGYAGRDSAGREGWYAETQLEADIYRRLSTDSITSRYQRNLEHSMIKGLAPTDTAYPMWVRGVLGAVPLERSVLSAVGRPVAPFAQGFWFGPGDTVPGAPPGLPRQGRVTLVASVDRDRGRAVGEGPELAQLRRLFERYAKDGLDVVLVDKTVGYAFGSPPLEPAAEAKVSAWYFHQVLGLPMPLVVLQAAVVTSDDGRRIPQPATLAPGLTAPDVGFPLLIGRDQAVYGLNFPTYATQDGHVLLTPMLEAVIRQALGLPEIRIGR